EYDDLGLYGNALVELVEAAVRAGAADEAADALRRLTERTGAAGTDWALGVEARSRALLSEGAAADRHYLDAIERLGRPRGGPSRARTRVVAGEGGGRGGGRGEAREQLRPAPELFSGGGVGGSAERPRRELRATGETVRARTAESRDVLTSQESQIARLAQD